jgi:hypothetical protein
VVHGDAWCVVIPPREKWKLITTTTHQKLRCGDGHHRGKLMVVTATILKKIGL